MESLYNWMLANGYDPATLPYIFAAIAFFILLAIMFYLKGDKTEPQVAESKIEEAKLKFPQMMVG